MAEKKSEDLEARLDAFIKTQEQITQNLRDKASGDPEFDQGRRFLETAELARFGGPGVTDLLDFLGRHDSFKSSDSEFQGNG